MNVIYEADQIREMLPHRPPFLFLDRVIELKPGEKGVGVKNVTISEPFFQGHFPKRAILPGVMILEAMAQMIAVVYTSAYLNEKIEENIASRVGYLAAIKNIKFKRLVVPGEQMLIEVEKGKSFGPLSNFNVKVTVNREIVAEGILTVSQNPENPND